METARSLPLAVYTLKGCLCSERVFIPLEGVLKRVPLKGCLCPERVLIWTQDIPSGSWIQENVI